MIYLSPALVLTISLRRESKGEDTSRDSNWLSLILRGKWVALEFLLRAVDIAVL